MINIVNKFSSERRPSQITLWFSLWKLEMLIWIGYFKHAVCAWNLIKKNILANDTDDLFCREFSKICFHLENRIPHISRIIRKILFLNEYFSRFSICIDLFSILKTIKFWNSATLYLFDVVNTNFYYTHWTIDPYDYFVVLHYLILIQIYIISTVV